MSAPQTNLEKQERRHRIPIIGIIAAVIFALALFLFLPSNPTTPDPQTEDPAAPQAANPPLTPPADPPATPVADPPVTPDGDLPPVDTPTPDPDLPTEPLPDDGAPTP